VAETLAGSKTARADLLLRAATSTDELDPILDAVAAVAADGNELALEVLLELVSRLELARPPIARLITESATIDDVAQATLSAVERNIVGFEGRARFRTWLWTVARNAALMHLRRRTEEQFPETDGAYDPAPPLGTRRMSSVIASRQTINGLIAALPDHYRAVIEMQVYEQLDYAEMAARLNVPIGTVRSRLAKAREILAEGLGEF
jgi:RNA polymerase sigma-70 factor (ECF subfamily)